MRSRLRRMSTAPRLKRRGAWTAVSLRPGPRRARRIRPRPSLATHAHHTCSRARAQVRHRIRLAAGRWRRGGCPRPARRQWRRRTENVLDYDLLHRGDLDNRLLGSGLRLCGRSQVPQQMTRYDDPVPFLLHGRARRDARRLAPGPRRAVKSTSEQVPANSHHTFRPGPACVNRCTRGDDQAGAGLAES